MSNARAETLTYDKVVYYAAPAVLLAAILFCCFRMLLVYYMQRPRLRRNHEEIGSINIAPRESELRAASGAFPTAMREIFRNPPPPNYEQTIKNDRRAMSAVENTPTITTGRRRRTSSRRDALRRARSNVVQPSPPLEFSPPPYRSLSIEELDSTHLSPYSRERLPSYEQVISRTDSRRPTIEV